MPLNDLASQSPARSELIPARRPADTTSGAHPRTTWKLGIAVLALAAQHFIGPQALAVSDAQKNWQQVYSRGVAAFELNQYGNAERALKEAVIKAQSLDPTDIRRAKSAGELGRLLTVRGRFSEAEPYLEQELYVKEQSVGNTDGKLIAAMGSLVMFYLEYGTRSKADWLTDRVLLFVEGKIKEEDEQRQAKVKLQKGAVLEAWAGVAAPAMRDPLIEWAITCDELGNAYLSRGNLALADRLFKAALDIKATVLGKHHLSLANSYDSLGTLCMAREEARDAESYFKDALEITERIQPPAHPQVYARLDKLGRCLLAEKKNREAEELYLRATRLWKAEPSPCGDEARALFALGSLYTAEKRYSEAAPLLKRALGLSESFNGPDSIAITPYLRKYAYCLYYLGARGEVAQLRARADRIAPIVLPLKTNAVMQAGMWSKKEAPAKRISKQAKRTHKAKAKKHKRKRKRP